MTTPALPPDAFRSAANDLVRILDDHDNDPTRCTAAVEGVLAELLALPGLDQVRAMPALSTSGGTGPTAGWLYQDQDIRITRGTVPGGYRLPAHNHGSWNILGVYDGAMHYRSFRRADDGRTPYRADLEIVEDRVMAAGACTVLPAPPHDVHTVLGLAPATTTLLVARGAFLTERERYFVDEGAFMVTRGDPGGHWAQSLP